MIRAWDTGICVCVCIRFVGVGVGVGVWTRGAFMGLVCVYSRDVKSR